MSKTVPYILVVDDDIEDSKIISQTIQEFSGIGVQTLMYSEQVVSHLEKQTSLPSLIILDYNMPVMNGEEVLAALKSHPRLQQIPVIPYSTYMSTSMRKNLTSLGAYDCYFKPSNYSMLVQQAKIFGRLALFFANRDEEIGTSEVSRAE